MDQRKVSESSSQGDVEVRKGPWTMEEDLILINYIANHGEGVWNSLAKSAGLKRTGKSCRLRWLNYLRPDVRRGNITPEEQLIIMELHAKWGNRWSKIAKHLPGRTDNEIKNYWRTRIQKHIRQADSINQSNANRSQSSDMMIVINNDQASTSHEASSTHVDAMAETYNSSPMSYDQANYNNVDHHHHHHHHHDHHQTNYSNLALPPSNNVSNDQSYNWSMEEIWSMQLLNSD